MRQPVQTQKPRADTVHTEHQRRHYLDEDNNERESRMLYEDLTRYEPEPSTYGVDYSDNLKKFEEARFVRKKLNLNAPIEQAKGKGKRAKVQGGGSAFIQRGARGGTFFTVDAGSLSTVEKLHMTLIHSTNPSLRTTRHHLPHHRILLVGEADFSFAEALAASLLPSSSATSSPRDGMILATTLDSHDECSRKYPSAPRRCTALRRRGVEILHGVDCTVMAQDKRVVARAPLDRVVFNFPHVGGATREDVAANRVMLSGFFASCRRLLAEDGQAHVALRRTSFYDGFGVEELAKEAGMKVKEKGKFEVE
ncbi:hypothetical protein HK101_009956, partial [Irineochytrium annulatum]